MNMDSKKDLKIVIIFLMEMDELMATIKIDETKDL